MIQDVKGPDRASIVAAFVIAACGGGGSGGGAPGSGSAAAAVNVPDTVHLGASLPLTGADSTPGKFMKDAYELYIKQAGVEKIRLEGEAAEQRKAADEERARNEAARAAAAKEVQHVVSSLGEGLEAVREAAERAAIVLVE